ncbi:MAG: hypothetical protein A2741_01580 [Candidatus Zambryskibacteria bacterium RIFCSPHIGHO2_01_FULL_43_27]|uniref:Uncharacterized protein n=1 Tax=Candidatus Zambryskibacteria bacterium RIFCSPLOWO2_01_FULL_43_17 TaxID=1802760 RepID=A0A1G2U608_9BACT|nr:MAG: hypothetical protein A2741_01580 [Candidatus Zambryskibacteria bacterium RIFCSPHIGHO2_01_FULL_43_27]OHA99471.1 MAG: hypothetical protein A3E93_02735 [Candidatus Zambryskibacteria bacterium RIFCSPHIGHO2_12_FULL_43_12b]OHB04312.1 MAG: hypothetical protein A2920_03325 [Candidatus Zambryskibacteria bacterium RIFCSPLOWO2_01_FULL_43_17]
MDLLIFLPEYFRWHYSRAWKDLARNCSQFIRFTISFFSITFLVRTLFAPWKRMKENYEKGFDPEGFFSTLIVNLIMRLVGFVIRTFALAVGIVAVILVLLISALVFVFWALFPAIVAFLFAIGIVKIFS